MTGVRLLDRDQITGLLIELAGLLPARAEPYELVVVGGAFMALTGDRRSTADVDTITPLGPEVRRAASELAPRHDLVPDWLNDRARPFAPHGWRQLGPTRTLLALPDAHRPRLIITGPSPDVVFLMKVAANRDPRDRADARALWPHTSFASPDQAAACFVAAYPLEVPDPFLADLIAGLIAGPEPGAPAGAKDGRS